ncbi:MAG: carboxypeptidase-like regulatory domain-containing protein [Candidatus Korobacteraceae bacterium]
MGPSMWKKNSNPFLQVTVLGAALICCLLLSCSPLLAQADTAITAVAPNPVQGRTGDATVPTSDQPQVGLAIGSVGGTVLDVTGTPVSGAEVKLTRGTSTASRVATTASDGSFSFVNVAPGPFDLSITLKGFKTKAASGTVPATEGCLIPVITLELAPVVTDVSVRLTTEEIAAEQIKVQEQQRLVGVIPNFYATYVSDAAPMNTKQKFGLAWKAAIDPTSFVIAGIIAGGEQADNSFPGYGQGAAGYARRFGAAYGDFFIGNYISNAILPSILKQDPRYFYKGTGTIKSRILYALEMSVMTKGDNGNWQPNYSGILGSLASGAISSLYYPEGSQHGFETTLNNTLIGIATGAGVNILQEFVFPKVTPKKPPKIDHPTS